MDISVFGVIVIVLGALSLVLSFQWAIYGMATCALFGATQTVSVGSFGILPANLFLLFFVCRALCSASPSVWMKCFERGNPGLWLLCVLLYASLSAVAFPRVLHDSTLVFAIDRTDSSTGEAVLQPLAPVSGNLSQSLYLFGEFALYVGMSILMRKRNAGRFFANAMLFLAMLNIGAAILDLTSSAIGLDVLSEIKTAQYAIIDGAEVGGMARITGTFSEASAFSSFALPLFAFSVNLWLLGYRKRISGPVALLTIAFLAASTSSTAYLGLLVYLCTFLLGRSGAVASGSGRRKLRMAAVFVLLIVLTIGILIAIDSPIIQLASNLIDETLLQKLDSDSGVERSAWNTQAFTNLLETDGLGVGLGSARASSFLALALSNLGIVGATLFGLFCYRSLRMPQRNVGLMEDKVVSYSAGQAMLAVLICSAISGTVFDLGPCFYMFAAAVFNTSGTTMFKSRSDARVFARGAGH
jgi:hypothetical protein